MSLSWNEIKSRAVAFSKKWEDESSERAEAQSFWNDFFEIFGINRRRVAVFEKQVKLSRVGEKIKRGRIDAFWKGVLLIEHKSADQDLDRAFKQATDYFDGIAERDLPRYILVSDFARFRLFDLEALEGHGNEIHFKLSDLHKNIKRFGFIAGYKAVDIKPQNPVNLKAAERMGKLHDQLKASGYTDHPLELLLVRLLFCLFADSTGIFEPAQSFRSWIEERTREDGSDLGPQLALLFQVLNTHESRRASTMDEDLRAFKYINGKLFEETLPMASFDSKMRNALLDCCNLDWSAISPAIFGALFQSIMDDTARRNLGAHYTSEENILKLIKPLFLDALWAEFTKIKTNRNRLFEFHKKLRGLTFFDPACGCGNFLVISYRELRLLELEVLRMVHGAVGPAFLDIHQQITLDVDQFYGIEIEEFPAQIAQVAMWLIDHQMNVKVGEEFGMYFARIPLKSSPHVLHGNALRIDWASVLPPEGCSYVMGNPPFIGHQWRNEEQVVDMNRIWGVDGRFGRLDYVTCWYQKATEYSRSNKNIKCAFVSTNSICQGEQVSILWAWLLGQGINIHFAHRTFQWTNEARGKAAVHCVIVGFSFSAPAERLIFAYDDIRGEPHVLTAKNINPYLVDAPDILLPSRTHAPASLPQLLKGSQPTDGGHLILNAEERRVLISAEPAARKWLRQFVGGEELINGGQRWCLWLKDATPSDLKAMPEVMKRVRAVANARRQSPTKSVQEFSAYPTLFTQDRQPARRYIALPEVSSENRLFIPIDFLDANIIASNKLQVVEGGALYHFGILCSTMHNAWMRTVAGRLESRYSYAPSVYNNFPWPDLPSDAQVKKIEGAAQLVLNARAEFPDSSLADLYDPITMPPVLVKAHHKLDAAVDSAYGKQTFKSDAERVAYLFELYQQYTSLLPSESAKPKRATKKK